MTHIYLQKAIRNKEVVSFTYEGVKRIVEPYVLGLNADGQIALVAWQLSGGDQAGWEDYLIDKIRGVSPTDLYFRKPKVDIDPDGLQMQHVLTWVGAPVVRAEDLFF